MGSCGGNLYFCGVERELSLANLGIFGKLCELSFEVYLCVNMREAGLFNVESQGMYIYIYIYLYFTRRRQCSSS